MRRAALPRIVALVLGLTLLGPAGPVRAQNTDPLVYWPLVTDGGNYRRVAYPEEAGSILVLADTEVVIEPRRAPVFYWAITREYLADMAKGTPLSGVTLDIEDPSGAAQAIEPETYVVWYPEGVGGSAAKLLRGEAATALYADYVEKARASAEELQAYQRARAEHQALLEAWLKMAGERGGKNMPSPPPELDLRSPEPYRAFATDPAEAFVVSLPAGRYKVRLRSRDGAVVQGSERSLVSFAARDQGVGYVIRQEDRWTQPLASFAPDEVIYTTAQTDLFFEPLRVAEYEARHFARLFRPQSVGTADPSVTLWAPSAGAEPIDGPLVAWRGSERIATLPQTGFRVVQTAGALRGYSIEEFAAGPAAPLTPDFVAARVSRDMGSTRLALAGPDGSILQRSERRLRAAMPAREALLLLPALLPLAVGATVRIVARRGAGGLRLSSQPRMHPD